MELQIERAWTSYAQFSNKRIYGYGNDQNFQNLGKKFDASRLKVIGGGGAPAAVPRFVMCRG
jgi:hypothetical protein